MGLELDSSGGQLQLVLDAVTVSGSAGKLEVVELATVVGGVPTAVGAANKLPVIIATDSIIQIPAGDYTADQVAAALSDTVVYNRVPYTILTAYATLPTGTADTNIVAAVAGKKIVVLTWWVMALTAPMQMTFKTRTGTGAGTAIGPAIPCNTNGGLSPPVLGSGWMRTATGDNLSGGTNTGGSSVSVQVAYIAV